MSRKSRHYYAATLRGENPSAISSIFEFDSESTRNKWIEGDKSFPSGIRCKLTKSLVQKSCHTPVPAYIKNEYSWGIEWKYIIE